MNVEWTGRPYELQAVKSKSNIRLRREKSILSIVWKRTTFVSWAKCLGGKKRQRWDSWEGLVSHTNGQESCIRAGGWWWYLWKAKKKRVWSPMQHSSSGDKIKNPTGPQSVPVVGSSTLHLCLLFCEDNLNHFKDANLKLCIAVTCVTGPAGKSRLRVFIPAVVGLERLGDAWSLHLESYVTHERNILCVFGYSYAFAQAKAGFEAVKWERTKLWCHIH
jgi:hypothetical protein